MTDWNDERPPYLRYAALLRAEIMSGDLVADEDDKLPSIAALMERCGTSSSSVIQRALGVLRDEGFITSQQGKGTFLHSEQVTPILATPHIVLEGGDGKPKPAYRLLEVKDEVPPADAGRALGIAPGEPAALRKQVLVRPEGAVVELVSNYFLAADAHGTPLAERRLIRGGSKAFFESVGRWQSDMDDVITTRPATTEEAQVLRLPAGVSVLRTLRTITDQHGAAMEVSVLIKSGNRWAIRHHHKIL